MPSLKNLVLTALVATGINAMPATQKLTDRQLQYHQAARRQSDGAAALGLTDFDILQFALTLEHLEETFYRQGFQLFPDADFAALGLTAQQISDLKQIGKTEEEHVHLLQGALAQNGIRPVQPCTYEFGFTDAAGMVATAGVLESVGVAAYLGAAPLIADKGILGTAASILTIESRHQSSIRVFGAQEAVPQAFDVALGPRAVFSLAAPFIVECPEGSNLQVEGFPTLAMAEGSAIAAVDGTIRLASEGAAGATHCAFTSGGLLPAGTKFTEFTEGEGCIVPQGVAGVSYVSLTNSAPLGAGLTDDITVAGPMVVVIT